MSESYAVTLLQNRVEAMQAEIDELRAKLDSLFSKIHIGQTGNFSWQIEPPPAE